MARRSKFGLSFSWKRASGLSAAKAKLSRSIGIPLSKSGRQRKLGRMIGSLGFAALSAVASSSPKRPAVGSKLPGNQASAFVQLPNPSIVNASPAVSPDQLVPANELHIQLGNASAWHDSATSRYDELSSQLVAVNSRIASAKVGATLRGFHRLILRAVPPSWHIASTVIIVWTAVCLAAAIAYLTGLQFFSIVAVVAISGVVTSAVAWLILFRTPRSTLEQRIADARHAAQVAVERRDQITRLRNAAADDLERAGAEVDRIQAILQSRIFRLVNEPFREYRGERFEQFLAEVFQERGFTVSLTKTTGDQGIDLILELSGILWAVQAKGYVSSVGNDAVQQAHAGCGFYRCHRSAVVTNSVFTASAKELAERLSPPCFLICGDDIPAVIRGELELR